MPACQPRQSSLIFSGKQERDKAHAQREYDKLKLDFEQAESEMQASLAQLVRSLQCSSHLRAYSALSSC